MQLRNAFLIINVYLIIFSFIPDTKCAKILGIFPMVGGSHFKMSSALMRGLASAGNNVTIISPYEDNRPIRNGSYRTVVLDGFANNYHNDMKKFNLFEIQDFNKFTQEATFQEYMYSQNELLVKMPSVQKLIKSKETFDAVIVEQFSNDGLKVFAHVFNAHLIVFCPIGANNFVNRLIGNPTMVSYNPQVVTMFSRPMKFIDRVHNTLLYTYEEIMNHFVFLPRQERFIRENFPGAPNIYDITTNVSLVLLNSHESIWQSVPLVPNAVPIGGYHISPPKKLPKEIQEFLDIAKDGVIFFSLGTNLKFSDMPEVKKRIFINTFSKLKQKVLWKLDGDIHELPENVKVAKWLPQRDILAHPNIKLFISHGGLLSITETIYNGVPILVIPVYGDQATNANHAVKTGYGLSINYHDPDFTKEKLTATMQELLQNPKYKKNALKQSNIFHDRPMKPLDTAIYWVDFIIKHGGATHLRVDGLYLPWYQYLLIDVIAFLSIVLLLLVLTFILLIKAIFAINNDKSTKIKKI